MPLGLLAYSMHKCKTTSVPSSPYSPPITYLSPISIQRSSGSLPPHWPRCRAGAIDCHSQSVRKGQGVGLSNVLCVLWTQKAGLGSEQARVSLKHLALGALGRGGGARSGIRGPEKWRTWLFCAKLFHRSCKFDLFLFFNCLYLYFNC